MQLQNTFPECDELYKLLHAYGPRLYVQVLSQRKNDLWLYDKGWRLMHENGMLLGSRQPPAPHLVQLGLLLHFLSVGWHPSAAAPFLPGPVTFACTVSRSDSPTTGSKYKAGVHHLFKAYGPSDTKLLFFERIGRSANPHDDRLLGLVFLHDSFPLEEPDPDWGYGSLVRKGGHVDMRTVDITRDTTSPGILRASDIRRAIELDKSGMIVLVCVDRNNAPGLGSVLMGWVHDIYFKNKDVVIAEVGFSVQWKLVKRDGKKKLRAIDTRSELIRKVYVGKYNYVQFFMSIR
eukprot:gene3292-3797_t